MRNTSSVYANFPASTTFNETMLHYTCWVFNTKDFWSHKLKGELCLSHIIMYYNWNLSRTGTFPEITLNIYIHFYTLLYLYILRKKASGTSDNWIRNNNRFMTFCCLYYATRHNKFVWTQWTGHQGFWWMSKKSKMNMFYSD